MRQRLTWQAFFDTLKYKILFVHPWSPNGMSTLYGHYFCGFSFQIDFLTSSRVRKIAYSPHLTNVPGPPLILKGQFHEINRAFYSQGTKIDKNPSNQCLSYTLTTWKGIYHLVLYLETNFPQNVEHVFYFWVPSCTIPINGLSADVFNLRKKQAKHFLPSN